MGPASYGETIGLPMENERGEGEVEQIARGDMIDSDSLHVVR